MPVCVMTTEYYKDEIKMEKQLKDLIAAIDAKRVVGSLDKRIVEVTNDRLVRARSLSPCVVLWSMPTSLSRLWLPPAPLPLCARSCPRHSTRL